MSIDERSKKSNARRSRSTKKRAAGAPLITIKKQPMERGSHGTPPLESSNPRAKGHSANKLPRQRSRRRMRETETGRENGVYARDFSGRSDFCAESLLSMRSTWISMQSFL